MLYYKSEEAIKLPTIERKSKMKEYEYQHIVKALGDALRSVAYINKMSPQQVAEILLRVSEELEINEKIVRINAISDITFE